MNSDIKIIDMVRKPFKIKAVQVTTANMDGVAEWCGGVVRNAEHGRSKHLVKVVYVETLRAVADWQKQARVGDWLVKVGDTFKIYTNKALVDSFDEMPGKTPSFELNEILRYERDTAVRPVDCD